MTENSFWTLRDKGHNSRRVTAVTPFFFFVQRYRIDFFYQTSLKSKKENKHVN